MLILTAGCASTPKPPAYSLYDHDALAVLPFQNLTQDPGLAQELQDAFLARLVQLNAVPVIEGGRVSALVAREDADPASLQHDAAARAAIARQLESDVLLVGSVTSYSEGLSEGSPRRVKVAFSSDRYRWGFYENRTVQVMASIKLIDTATGRILWVKNAQGSSGRRHWVALPYDGDKESPPSEGWSAYLAARSEVDLGYTSPAADARAKRDRVPPGHAKGQSSQPVINIHINNSQSQQQSQTQTARAAASAGDSAANPALLHRTDPVFSALRANALQRAAAYLVSDFQGRGGWKPGMQVDEES
ncbi:MAG: hypothetical protein GWN53_19220 [Gammaproteobacteria bacterium]|nr:hypothetical protein [Gammaproteobacteria bacterium]